MFCLIASSTPLLIESTYFFYPPADPSRSLSVLGTVVTLLTSSGFRRPFVFISFSATALQSLEIACYTFLSGKAKVMLAGGLDDISEEGSYEFANMKATTTPRLNWRWVVSQSKCQDLPRRLAQA